MANDIQTRVMYLQTAFTLILVLVTGAYVVLTKGTADAARQEAETSAEQFQLSSKQFELSQKRYDEDSRPFVYFDGIKCPLTVDQDILCGATVRNVGRTPAMYEVTKAEISAGGFVEDIQLNGANAGGVVFPGQDGLSTTYLLSKKAQDTAGSEKRFKLILRVEYGRLGGSNQTSNSYEVHTLFTQKPESPKEYTPSDIVYTEAN